MSTKKKNTRVKVILVKGNNLQQLVILVSIRDDSSYWGYIIPAPGQHCMGSSDQYPWNRQFNCIVNGPSSEVGMSANPCTMFNFVQNSWENETFDNCSIWIFVTFKLGLIYTSQSCHRRCWAKRVSNKKSSNLTSHLMDYHYWINRHQHSGDHPSEQKLNCSYKSMLETWMLGLGSDSLLIYQIHPFMCKAGWV